ncbi:MAG: hypothetical protein AB7K35_06885 [Pseudorhodoplanes sp.]
MRLAHIAVLAALAAVTALPLVLALETADENAAAREFAAPVPLPAPAAKVLSERWPRRDWSSATAQIAADAHNAPTQPAPVIQDSAAATRDPAPEPQQAEAPAEAVAPSPADSPRSLRQAPPVQRAKAAAHVRRVAARARVAQTRRSETSRPGYYYEITGAQGYGETRVRRACVPGLRMPQVCYYPQNIRRNFPVRAAD